MVIGQPQNGHIWPVVSMLVGISEIEMIGWPNLHYLGLGKVWMRSIIVTSIGHDV